MSQKRKTLKRFAKQIEKLNSLHDHLDRERANFYGGGHTFERVYEKELEELETIEESLPRLLKEILSYNEDTERYDER